MTSHPKPSSSFLPLFLVFVIILGAGLYWHFSEISRLEKRVEELEQGSTSPETSIATNPTQETNEATTYTNEEHQYTLRYPSYLNLTAYTSEKAVLGIGTSSQTGPNNDQITVTVLEAKTNAEKKLSINDFIEKRVRLLCDASGGGVSVTCPQQKSLEPLSLASGLSAYTVTLEREEKTIGPEASVVTDEVVFFVINISGENETKLLVIYPIGEGTSRLAQTIAETVSLVK